ncbi:membrane protease YdiL (CAAX protease family) [Microbacterium trichothecenolyticum]|uniref:CPBP family intramembrane glutamic endopeptidase n=1 Tax=Microbacterium trichothecenolyticum TaxID=69370 RepID=UPI00285E698A|nr:CPBP family intramembrane glutamic endopeptidase [Microbacterium trichothecenolyticum]MDR7114060.1 membrane protease YdiL (CAAX protease family) [Microbacterium trichothecenolyticum]
MHTDATESSHGTNGWRRFWERGGWWRALLLVVAYYALYQLGSFAFLPLVTSTDDPAALTWFGTALPIALGGVLLVLFAWSVGWLRELFGPQPIRGRGWMWIAVAVVLVFNVLRFATIDYGAAGAGVVVAWVVAGLFVGFAEEVLTRGFVVNLMRKGGYREIVVALVSALLFALLHSGNLLSGQSPLATGFQLVYTFAFGILMYLSLRVTGNLIWPILLHATTDPSIFLQSAYPADGALTAVAAQGNIAVVIAGIVLLFFIRGKVEPTASVVEPGIGTKVA